MKIAKAPSVVAANKPPAEIKPNVGNVPVLKYIASRYKTYLMSELIRRLNPVYAAKRPQQEHLHTKSCPFCGRDVTVFKYTLLPKQIPGTVSMDKNGEIFFKCSNYQECKENRFGYQPPKEDPFT